MFEPHAHMQPLSLLLAVGFALVVTALFYLRGWLHLRNALPNLIRVWRLVAFMCGLVSVWTVVAPPLATLDHQSLTIHMVKHLLLMTVAAPLVLAGSPLVILESWTSKCFLENKVLLGGLPAGSFERRLTHPVLCWFVGTSAVIGWHLPFAFGLAIGFALATWSRGRMFSSGRPLVLVARAAARFEWSGASVAHGFIPLPCHATV